ncbi:hypothetical protein [Streptomyces vilmorinianum]|uniref:hypothetical protein n=1 Tax=Streptomyces vilmorinianum TaxID=3051092 RepID=UPI0020C79EA7|nr:hypothetical protein [Streptomyces vilmorinianum]
MVLRRIGGRSRLAALAAATALFLGPALVGCGDDNGGTPSETTPVVPPAPTTAAEPADPAAAKAEITKNWTAFFDPKTPTADKVKLLENGEQMQPVLAALGSNPNAATTSVKVTGIAFTSATGADVTYDLLVSGAPALPDSKGTSVLQDDTWKVSVKTLCGLVQLSGATVPGC